jgi:NADH:ubiquinone oxidoreductase subunit 6 (subunit J)
VDLVLTIVFFICAILAVAGALAASLGPAASWRLLGLLGLAVGTAGVLVSLWAGFAALVALVCLGASALLLGGVDAAPGRAEAPGRAPLSGQVGAAAAALLLVLLLVVAVRGTFAAGGGPAQGFDPAAVGRALLGRDALALEAVGAALTAAFAVGALARSRRP